MTSGADPGFFKGGGVYLRSTSKKGGSRRGSNFGSNVKKPISWPKNGGGEAGPLDPPDPPMDVIMIESV